MKGRPVAVLVKFIIVLGLIFVCFLTGCDSNKTENLHDKIELSIERALEQYLGMLDEMNGNITYPRSVNTSNGITKYVNEYDWTSGFFPGSLWYLYELTGNDEIKKSAVKYTEGLEAIKYDSTTHDLGFMIFCSYGNAYRLTKNPKYKEVIEQSAATLSTRYSNTVGCIRSWDFGKWKFPVIIDNMMNLELLYWVGKSNSNNELIEIADSHAYITMLNHYRENMSTYHVVDYDPSTGNVIDKCTFQGLHNESEWSRGQAWSLYGFVMSYRETGREDYLLHSKRIANYLINYLKNEAVPYWDFSLPSKVGEPRDASAAAIIASALIELYVLTDNHNKQYIEVATDILNELTSDNYLADAGSNNFFILKHSTGHKPHNSEIDVPLNYADYYFIEAIKRYKDLKLSTNI
jgi:unsaturated chondroitin disaccharide hydrolase